MVRRRRRNEVSASIDCNYDEDERRGQKKIAVSSTCVEITYIKSVQKNLLLEGISNRNDTRRFHL
jgi:hypothetical protein